MAQAETDAPDDAVWLAGLKWVEAAWMQASRVEEAAYELDRAYLDARTRYQLRAPSSDVEREWRDHYDQSDIGDQPARVPTWALEMQVGSEVDFLMVAVRNVLRAQERLPDEIRTSMIGQDVLKLLRDASEHFDQVGGRALTSLARRHPDIVHDAVASNGKEVWIGGERGVPVSRIVAWVSRAGRAFRAALATLDVNVPDDLLTSRVENDDELVWPADRLKFGWWLPTAEESTWPTREAPDHIGALVAERFARRRARDGAD